MVFPILGDGVSQCPRCLGQNKDSKQCLNQFFLKSLENFEMYVLKIKLHFPFKNLKIKLPQKKGWKFDLQSQKLNTQGLNDLQIYH